MSNPIYDSLRAETDSEKELTIENVQKTFAPKPNEDLQEWWVEKAEDEIDGMLAKTSEYGAGHRDPGLVSVGQDFATTMGRGKVSDAEAAEIAIWFYIRGKVARAYSALADGRMPSDDTILDIGVYNRMLQRVREVGGWPN